MRAVTALAVFCSAAIAIAAPPDEPSVPQAEASVTTDLPSSPQVTPPRLGYVEGEVLFWRPGAGDWEAAQVNLPLAEGDALATRDGKLELQVGRQSFVRAGANTQMRVKSNEPGFLQVEVTAGQVAVDVRELRRGDSIDVLTASGSMRIDRDGYYRVDVDAGDTRVTVRRGGRATVTPTDGSSAEVATGEAVQMSGAGEVRLTALAAPAFDDWDSWNYARAERFLDAPRGYGSPDVYGLDDLDRSGEWRTVDTYGRVWVPASVPVGWAPYTNGRWVWDPLYGYSWVDYAPWGWAPYHYGRWVYSGYWAWAPGPIVATPVYSPALVAFFGAPGFSVGIGFPFVSWVALGWGEPLFPWWGPVGFIGRPCWWGWGGPRWWGGTWWGGSHWGHWNGQPWNGQHWAGGQNWRGRQGVGQPQQVNGFRNTMVRGAVVSVPRDQFGSRSVNTVRLSQVNPSQLKPIHGALPVAAKGVPAGAAAKMPVPNLPARGPANAMQAKADVSRSGQTLAGPRGVASGTLGGTSRSAALDAVHRAGPGALTAPPRSGASASAAPLHSMSSRGSGPPPLPSSARNVVNGVAAAAPARSAAVPHNYSDSFARVRTQPPPLNRYAGPGRSGSVNVSRPATRSMSPPPVGRGFASVDRSATSYGGWSAPAARPSGMAGRAAMPAPSMAQQGVGHASGGSFGGGGGHVGWGGGGHSFGGMHGGGGGHR